MRKREGEQRERDARAHRQRPGRERLDRNGDLGPALVAVDAHSDLPGAGRHHPQARGVKARIVGRLSGFVWNGRELRSGPRDAERHDVDLARTAFEHADFDLRHAGDDGRRPDGDEQPVRAGAALPEDIRAADVRGDVRRRRHGERQQRRTGGDSHRCSRWSHAPSARPARALSGANAKAMAIRVQNAASAGAY